MAFNISCPNFKCPPFAKTLDLAYIPILKDLVLVLKNRLNKIIF